MRRGNRTPIGPWSGMVTLVQSEKHTMYKEVYHLTLDRNNLLHFAYLNDG